MERLQAAVGDHYRILKELGGGGMSRVFLAAGASGDLLWDPFVLPEALKRSGELYEAKGDRRNASDRYRRFVELWANADPELQPGVREVRERLARLATETPS